MNLFAPNIQVARDSENNVTSPSHCCKQMCNIQPYASALGWGHAIEYIIFDVQKKTWFAGNQEFATPIQFCPFCSLRLDFAGNESESEPAASTPLITRLREAAEVDWKSELVWDTTATRLYLMRSAADRIEALDAELAESISDADRWSSVATEQGAEIKALHGRRIPILRLRRNRQVSRSQRQDVSSKDGHKQL